MESREQVPQSAQPQTTTVEVRPVKQIVDPQVIREGAGVLVRRTIGSAELDMLDPFLLLDFFGSDNPTDFQAGFPMHPHRGIQTVTYVLDGDICHRDNLGNSGCIGAGDAQWVNAGRGILHEEMPDRLGPVAAVQLWINLPAALKMSEPRYQEIPSGMIPQAIWDDGTIIRVLAGVLEGIGGPVEDISVEPIFLDILVVDHNSVSFPLPREHNAFALVLAGQGIFGARGGQAIHPEQLVVFGPGDQVDIHTDIDSVRLLLVSGKPLNEPVARGGPVVMNTPEEVQDAFRELREGTFAKES